MAIAECRIMRSLVARGTCKVKYLSGVAPLLWVWRGVRGDSFRCCILLDLSISPGLVPESLPAGCRVLLLHMKQTDAIFSLALFLVRKIWIAAEGQQTPSLPYCTQKTTQVTTCSTWRAGVLF